MSYYSKKNLEDTLPEAISRLTNMGIGPRTINNLIKQEAEDWDLTHFNQEEFSPLEKLIIGRNIFEKKALEKAINLIQRIRENININLKRAKRLTTYFRKIAREVYYFNENLPPEYTIKFDEEWGQYDQLRKQLDKLQHPRYT